MVVKNAGTEPGGSEFSYGKGLQSPESLGHVPTEYEQMRAIYALNPADTGAAVDYVAQGFVRETTTDQT